MGECGSANWQRGTHEKQTSRGLVDGWVDIGAPMSPGHSHMRVVQAGTEDAAAFTPTSDRRCRDCDGTTEFQVRVSVDGCVNS